MTTPKEKASATTLSQKEYSTAVFNAKNTVIGHKKHKAVNFHGSVFLYIARKDCTKEPPTTTDTKQESDTLTYQRMKDVVKLIIFFSGKATVSTVLFLY